MTKQVPVVICRTHSKAAIPTYRTEGAAGFDLTAVESKLYTAIDNGVSHLAYIIRTGIKVAIPEGYCMKIYARTDLGYEHHARPAQCVGIIDSDYHEEIIIKLVVESGARPLTIKDGMFIAQGLIEEVTKASFDEISEEKFTELNVERVESGSVPADTETSSAEKGKTAKSKAEK
ncbi:dUTP diphosphatase [Xenorhabdus bovienii]|uniref:dUTP diphosphatase n=1 Tax=Xenorhabdus bovienii TaxID=40576 RepID=UPI003DA3ADC2